MKLSKKPSKRQKQLNKVKPHFTPHRFFLILPRRCEDGVLRWMCNVNRVAYRNHHDDPITYKYLKR